MHSGKLNLTASSWGKFSAVHSALQLQPKAPEQGQMLASSHSMLHTTSESSNN